MKYFYTHKDGKKEQVLEERWQWGIVYDDNTELHQFDIHEGEGRFHRIDEIQHDRVKLAVLFKPETNERIDIPFQKGMKIIHKYRNFMFEVGTENERRSKVYIFGYNLGKFNNYMFILPDDRIIVSPIDNVELVKFGV